MSRMATKKNKTTEVYRTTLLCMECCRSALNFSLPPITWPFAHNDCMRLCHKSPLPTEDNRKWSWLLRPESASESLLFSNSDRPAVHLCLQQWMVCKTRAGLSWISKRTKCTYEDWVFCFFLPKLLKSWLLIIISLLSRADRTQAHEDE